MDTLSRRLAYVLRHDPGSVGLALDEAGRVPVGALIAALGVTRERLVDAVNAGAKRRFVIEGEHVRALQGHSVPITLALLPVTPPDVLFHGTIARFLPAIRAEGLRRRERHHVHLSAQVEEARIVAMRRGTPVVIRVRAGDMASAGSLFYRAENGVWLTEHVAPELLEVPGEV